MRQRSTRTIDKQLWSYQVWGDKSSRSLCAPSSFEARANWCARYSRQIRHRAKVRMDDTSHRAWGRFFCQNFFPLHAFCENIFPRPLSSLCESVSGVRRRWLSWTTSSSLSSHERTLLWRDLNILGTLLKLPISSSIKVRSSLGDPTREFVCVKISRRPRSEEKLRIN